MVLQVINQAGTAGAIYTDAPYDEDDSPSYPLDLYYNEGVNTVQVWSQSMAGGLPTSHTSGLSELKIATYRLDSAVSMGKRYARQARLDVVSKAVERMSQEILVKQERNAWAVVLKALGEASTGGNAHVVSSGVRDPLYFTLDDLNVLMTRIRRINESFASGTPDVAYSTGLTDLYVSPERMQDVRAMAYQPMNTRAADNSSAGEASDGIALSDNLRDNIWNGAGAQELYGMALSEVYELGVGQKYNTLFDTFAASTSYPASGGATCAATDEILVGVDASRDAFIRPVAQQAESGGTFTAQPDDQFLARHEKTGFWGYLEEGRVCIDARAVVGVIV